MFETFLKEHTFSEYTFRSDLFPTVEDRAFWNSFRNETCVEEAERAMGYGWDVIKATDFMAYKESGNRTIMQIPHFTRRNHLILFTLAELKENKGRFLPQIVNGLFAICEESFWGLSAHWHLYIRNIPTPTEPYVDLYAAETAEHLAVITHVLREPLKAYCPEILERVDYELEQRIRSVYLTHRDFFWMGWMWYDRKMGNWLPWIASNLLTVYLLTAKNEWQLHRALVKLFEDLQNYYAAMPNDGGCNEGPGYWSRAGASLFEFLYLLKLSTDGKLNLFGDEKIGKIAGYLKVVHMASDIFANVADAHAKGQAHMMLLLYGFARETKQPELMNFSAAVYQEKAEELKPLDHTIRTMRRLIWQASFLKEIEIYPVSYPLHGASECLPDLQLAVLRQGDWALCVKGGHNHENHNHNDVGSISLYDGTTPVLVDVGINTYTRFTFSLERYNMIPWTRSETHSLPVINGVQQHEGECFRADRFAAEAGKAEVSFAAAYPAEAGIEKLTRVLTAEEKRIVCTDCFIFREGAEKQVTEMLMSILPVRVEQNEAVIGERYRVRSNGGTMHCQFLSFEGDPQLESDWNAKGVYRIEVQVPQADQVELVIEKI